MFEFLTKIVPWLVVWGELIAAGMSCLCVVWVVGVPRGVSTVH
jgi:hypothetical protein